MPPSSDSANTAPATGLVSTPGDYGFSAGSHVGRHIILERVGGGGMGVVYSAYDPKLDRRVALKLLRPDATGSAEAQQRLLREAQTLARLSHPNVVNVYDVGEFESRVFVEMELVTGTTLADWLAAEPRDWPEVLAVFVQAGRGLAAAHALGIVHRDFKPDNVLVGADGRVRVADFGIALVGSTAEVGGPADAFDEAQPSAPPVVRTLGNPDARVGTPAYMAPEQRNGGRADARSDQYSFCLALREALSRARRPPPRWLDQAVAQGLSASPDARHPSTARLLELLESEPRRRQRRGLAATVGLAVVLASGSAWTAARSHRQGQARLCSSAEHEIGVVWGDAQRRVLEEAFGRTGLPYAHQTAAAVVTSLDRYARDWAAMHTDSCEATRVRGEQSDALMDRRMQCLDLRLTEARTLVEVFDKGEPRVVERAVQASQSLSPISECSAARVRSAARAEAGPADPAIILALGRARGLDAAGKYTDAIHSAEEALAGARASAHRGLEAQALELIGRAKNQKSDGPGAEKALFDAFVAAERAGDDGTAATAAIESGFAIGYLQNRTEEADKWFQLASVAIERLGGDDRRSVERIYSRSAVAWSAGKFKESIDETRAALRLSEDKLPEDTIERAYCLTGLGVGLMSQGETAEARGFLERALSLDEKALGQDHPNVEMDLFNLGTLAKAEGGYAEATALFTRALAIGQRSDPKGAMVALSRGALAEALMRLGRFDEARESVAQAIALSQTIDGVEKSRVADLYAIKGRLARLEKRYDDALRDLTRAMELGTATLGKDNPDLSDAIIGLARVYLETGKSKSAVPLLERALVLLHDLDPSELAEPRLALAQALWQSGGDRTRATALANQARSFYADVPARAPEVREIEDWFAKHGGP